MEEAGGPCPSHTPGPVRQGPARPCGLAILRRPDGTFHLGREEREQVRFL